MIKQVVIIIIVIIFLLAVSMDVQKDGLTEGHNQCLKTCKQELGKEQHTSF